MRDQAFRSFSPSADSVFRLSHGRGLDELPENISSLACLSFLRWDENNQSEPCLIEVPCDYVRCTKGCMRDTERGSLASRTTLTDSMEI